MSSRDTAITSLIQHLQKGESHAISMRDLAMKLGINDRTLRWIVYNARRRGYPVISGMHGYYLPEDENAAGSDEARLLRSRRKAAQTTLESIAVFSERLRSGTAADDHEER